MAEKRPPEVAEKRPPEVAEKRPPEVAEKRPPEVAEKRPPEVAEKRPPEVAEKRPPEVAEKRPPEVAEKRPPEVAEKRPPAKVHAALKLDGDSATVKQYYDDWALTYNADLKGNYVGTQQLVQWVLKWLEQNRAAHSPVDFAVVDVGCGTGLIGALLAGQGYGVIDGLDLSAGMIEQARGLGVYRHLTAGIDINLAIAPKWQGRYDLVTCCGVFTLGHVEPEALLNLIQFAKPGGLVALSTRTAYYDATYFQSVSDSLQTSGKAHLVAHLKEAPYTDDSRAHYWLYQVA